MLNSINILLSLRQFFSHLNFEEFNLNQDLLEGMLAMGLKTATHIQQQAIPVILSKKDLVACAQTGTGKTGAYLVPIINLLIPNHRRHNEVLILAPTRELAQQIDMQVEALSYFTNITSLTVYGGGDGVTYDQQKRSMKEGVDIIIATPGRLISHLTSGTLNMSVLKYLVLDEADRMLDMGFYQDIIKIVSYLPKNRQTMMFSATMPSKIRKLAQNLLKDPQQVNLSISKPAEGIDQQVYFVYDNQKIPLLMSVLKQSHYKSIIVFASRKELVRELGKVFKKLNFKASAFHSDLEQKEREAIMLDFKNKKLEVLIGTDVLSRGIDVTGVDLVINYDAPRDPEDYVHRIGRTARAASTGTAITLVNDKDKRKLENIEKLIGRTIDRKSMPEEFGEGTKNESLAQKKTRHENKKRSFLKKPFSKNA